MTGPCIIYQNMSIPLMSIYLLIVTVISPSSQFPIRHLGIEKKVTQHVSESRDLILCWIIQIMTNAQCNCVLDDTNTDAEDDGKVKDVSNDNSSSRYQFLQQSDCICQQKQIQEHISVLSAEVGLHPHHTFGHFNDHFLLCYVNIEETNTTLQQNSSVIKSKSHSISQIHKLHSDLKSNDKVLFDKRKKKVEDCLQHHEEILWFSSEYVHRHHSRSTLAMHLDLEDIQHQDKSVIDKSVIDTSVIADTKRHQFVNPKGVHIQEPIISRNMKTLVKDVVQSNTEDVTNSVVTLLLSDTRSFIHNVSDRNYFSVVSNTTKLLQSQNQPTESAESLHSLSRRSLDMNFNDPKYPQQWHLNNWLTKDMDINVTGVWKQNYTGRGVTVAVVDDGLEWTNPDIKANYNYKGSWDMNDNDPDPSPSANKPSNHHGTRCAGEIAAVANNHVCGVGVAYEAKVSGLRVLDGVMTDSMEADAFNMKMDINDIYSCSWGPEDDGKTVDGPHLMAAKALKHGVDFGRHGYGSIFVLASGNGGENKDNCNFDGYANSIYTVTVGAVDDKGGMPYYAEECASMIGVTFSSGTTRDIVTTDWRQGQGNGCTENHTGTSAAAPLAAAMIALMLQARPCLTWRDVQYLIILTGQKVDVDLAHSQLNGAGLSHSHKHGFGLLNSWRLVNAARIWKTVPFLTSYSTTMSDLNLSVPKGKDTSLRVDHVVSEADILGLNLFILENVQLTLTMSHPCRGKIEVKLISPSGTESILAAPRPKDNSSDGFIDWTFTSVRCWGETPTGNWRLVVIDHDDNLFDEGEVTKWRLTLFGTPMTREEFVKRQILVESAMSGEFLQANDLPCQPAQKFKDYSSVSDRTLKIFILFGAFCFIMAIYETLEYMFCYNDEKKETARNRLALQQDEQQDRAPAGQQDHNASSSLNGMISSSNNVEIDDDDEDDIFNTSESSSLLRDERRCINNTGVNLGIPEDMPLATFNVSSGETNQSGYILLHQDEASAR